MTYLYRLYDARSRLLYVGITDNIDRRIYDHSRSFGLELADVGVVYYHTRQEAGKAELEAIKAECPLWNVNGSPDGTRLLRYMNERSRQRQQAIWAREDELEAKYGWPLPPLRGAAKLAHERKEKRISDHEWHIRRLASRAAEDAWRAWFKQWRSA